MKYFTIVTLILLFSCSKPNYGNKPIFDTTSDALYICNEGNFMFGNASLSRYEFNSKKVFNQAFFNTNGFPIGDVLQSMAIIDGVGYLVVNNSGKIFIINPSTCQYLGTIEGLTSPRYVEKIDDTKFYVTDLYAGGVTIVNPLTLSIVGSIKTGKSTEQMVRYGDYVFVSSWSFNNQIYRIDSRTDKLIDSVTVNKQPNSIVVDKAGKIWTLSDGAYKGSPYGQQDAALTRIDAATFTIEAVFTFDDKTIAPSELTISPERDFIYYIGGNHNTSSGIYKMDINATSLPTEPFITSQNNLYYGLGINPYNGDIYVSDAIDYMQRGVSYIYNQNGAAVTSFKVGVTPGAFCFFKP